MVALLFTKIKMRFIGIIKENTVGYIIVYADVKRNGTINWVLVPLKRVSVGIPVNKPFTSQVKIGGLIPQTKKAFLRCTCFCAENIISAKRYIFLPVHRHSV